MASGVERLCVVIARTRHRMIQAEIQEAARRGATLIEVRLDFLAKAPDFKRLLVNRPCPLVATARRREDGGRWTGTEPERRLVLRQAIVAGFDWADVETDVADDIVRFKDVKRIVSYHNLQEVPANLEKIYEQMCQQDPDVVKLVAYAQRPEDNLRMLELLRNPKLPTIAFCLGDTGFPSRVLAARFGPPFGYAAFNKERRVALGIPSFDEMAKLYRYPDVTAETKVFGIIGDPVAHSLSPLIHNAAFRKLGLNAVYLPFRVPRGELPGFLAAFERVPVHGYSITIPHKEAALVASKYRDAAAVAAGAANTMIRGSDGFTAYNTDYVAARDSLLANLPKEIGGLDGRSVFVLGAGGVARAVVNGLYREGALVTIANRTIERAQQLSNEVGCRFVPWEARHDVNCAILINCTSVGMHPDVDETPIHPSFLSPDILVFDTVYTPENTLLIKEARARGCAVLTGMDMFVRQAEMQFKLFTGEEPPPGLMQSLAKRILSPVRIPEEDAG
jgi:3-dehydroquinate dehydratase/shikimate dehydrogenase